MGTEPADPPQIHTLSSLVDGLSDPLERYSAVDGLAFGVSNSTAYVEAKRLIVDPDRFVIALVDGVDAGAAGNFGFRLTVPGGAQVPVAGLADVGVITSHRRRGILRSMVSWSFDDAVDRGEVASLLTASQATIYGRFGYGVTELGRRVEIPVASAQFRDDVPIASGSLRVHDIGRDRAELSTVLPALHDRFAGTGSLTRTPEWWSVVLGDVETYVGGHAGQRALVRRDGDGEPDGYALFRVQEQWGDHGAESVIEVREVVAASPAVELALWSALFVVDLVVAVRATLPVRHLLDDALVDGRALRCRALRDQLWLRPLDVGALLRSRTYEADGVLTLSVVDRMRPDTGGTFRLQVEDGVATCERTSPGKLGPGGADLSLSVADLGARVLGGGSFRSIARAGRIEGLPASLARADVMFDTDPPAWTDTRF